MGRSNAGRAFRKLITVFGVSIALAVPAGLTGAAPALAYDGCESESSVTASTSAAVAGAAFALTVQVRDCTGAGVEGASVVFATQSAPQSTCQASFNPSQAATGSNGLASTQATLPSGCPCQYVLSARVPTSTGGFTLTTPVRESGCLPFTSAAAAAQSTTPSQTGAPLPLFGALLGLVALLVVAATGIAIRSRG